MKPISRHRFPEPSAVGSRLAALAAFALVAFSGAGALRGADSAEPPAPAPFAGEKSAWHGFDRYDYVMDCAELSLSPFKAPAGERSGIGAPPSGKRRCVVVAPRQAAPGRPWSWRGCYWDHEPQTEIELLNRGFHVAYVSADAALKPGKEWAAWHAFLTEKHGLSQKPSFIGMSRGGEYAYTWGVTHPDKVACIYADNPGGNRDMLMKLGDLASNDVPLLHICGSIDPLLGRVAAPIENIYHQWGGRITVMIKEGAGHHPHSLRDPKPIADWIEQNTKPAAPALPAFLPPKFTRAAFCSAETFYREYPKEGGYIACRGPGFSECYDRYVFDLQGVEGVINVIVPKAAAPGNPWVFRADFVSQDSVVDLALLARGFHIVTGPVPYNANGPLLAHWNAVYQHLAASGLSKKPVLAGAGKAAGEAYGWAVANPDKVACVYGENPVLMSVLAKTQPLDQLEPLAKAGVPLLHVCGSLDPRLNDQTRVAEQRYKQLGGQITVIVQEGQGHFPTAPKDPKAVVEFITAQTR